MQPMVDREAARRADLSFLEATDALLDTPSMELFFELLAAFPNAKVVLTAREPTAWARKRRARHPYDRAPLFHHMGLVTEMMRLSEAQAASALALWHRVVLASVPPERLLALDLFAMADEELWTKLCRFVERPLPPRGADGRLPPFPHHRYGDKGTAMA